MKERPLTQSLLLRQKLIDAHIPVVRHAPGSLRLLRSGRGYAMRIPVYRSGDKLDDAVSDVLDRVTLQGYKAELSPYCECVEPRRAYSIGQRQHPVLTIHLLPEA